MIKEIGQNKERYSKEGNQWKISASKDIKPIYLPIGVPISNLKPLITADGIIVKVNNDYLCSITTLNNIKDSNNPHYDIVQNGTIKVKDKKVSIGKTIRIIELDIEKLRGLADTTKLNSLKAGVSDTEYVYEGDKTDGISNNLINQINYTLTQLGIRGKDTYSLYKLKLAPDEAYSVAGLKDVQQQTAENNGLLDTIKLKVFSEGIAERLTLLREDFRMIKKLFFDGQIPNNDGKVSTSSQITDPVKKYADLYDDNHQVVYKEVGRNQFQDRSAGLRSFVEKLNQATNKINVVQSEAEISKQQLAKTQQQLMETQKKLSGK